MLVHQTQRMPKLVQRNPLHLVVRRPIVNMEVHRRRVRWSISSICTYQGPMTFTRKRNSNIGIRCVLKVKIMFAYFVHSLAEGSRAPL